MPTARVHVDQPLRTGAKLALPPSATRHVQVLRLQPGDALTLFDGTGGEWRAEVVRMGRREVIARALEHREVERELDLRVTIALGMPANDRMDTLVEKATELGVAAIQPLLCERSVLRVEGERALRKLAHWRAIASAACEQCGRNRLPEIGEPQPLARWLDALPPADEAARLLLSLDPAAVALAVASGQRRASQVTLLSGPEGGLSSAEDELATRRGFLPVSLGARVLRADTAPLAALACLATGDAGR